MNGVLHTFYLPNALQFIRELYFGFQVIAIPAEYSGEKR